jgi:hypothetical protein
MVWKILNEKNNKEMYLRRFGNMYVLSYDKKGAVDNLPPEWIVELMSGVPKLRRAN